MKRSRGLVPLAAMMLAAGSASAQSRGYAITPLAPASPGSDWYTTESLDLRGALRPTIGVLVDWAYAPLLTRGEPLPRQILTDQVNLHLRAGLVVRDRARLGVSAPLTLFQHGDTALSPPRAQAPGDLRVDADVRLAGAYGDAARLAAGVALHAPMGRRELFTSDGTFRVAPRLLLAGDVKAFAWAAKVAYQVRPFEGAWQGRALGDQLSLAVSAGVKVNDRFVMGPEVHGAATVTGPDALAVRAIPIELMLGGRVRLADHFQLGSAIGGRVTDGDGGAKMRVLAIFEYAPDVCVDKDGDGVCAHEDACPLAAGPRTRDRRTSGCPLP